VPPCCCRDFAVVQQRRCALGNELEREAERAVGRRAVGAARPQQALGTARLEAVEEGVADRPLSAADYRKRLQPLQELRHLTLEVHRCRGDG
jgi:hypothetical protein